MGKTRTQPCGGKVHRYGNRVDQRPVDAFWLSTPLTTAWALSNSPVQPKMIARPVMLYGQSRLRDQSFHGAARIGTQFGQRNPNRATADNLPSQAIDGGVGLELGAQAAGHGDNRKAMAQLGCDMHFGLRRAGH